MIYGNELLFYFIKNILLVQGKYKRILKLAKIKKCPASRALHDNNQKALVGLSPLMLMCIPKGNIIYCQISSGQTMEATKPL